MRWVVVVIAAGLSAADPLGGQTPPTDVVASPAAIAQARADSVRRPWIRADADFISGMVHHHAQAIHMARLAESHGAAPSIRILSGRIINAQQDEIRLMQQWLADRRLPIPTPSAAGATMDMNGTRHEMHMPGMMTPTDLAQLDSARGPAFDVLLLRFMVRHHNGAVSMVKQLFATPGAGQDETVFRLASDINADQTTEIARMNRMLLAIALGQPY